MLIKHFEKEKALLNKAIDTFFGTTNGYPTKWIQPVEVDGKTAPAYEVADTDNMNIREEMRELGLQLCGGAILSIFTKRPISDLDFYLEDISNKQKALYFLKKWFPLEAGSSINAVTLRRQSPHSKKKWTVQLITRFSGPPSKIFEWFDFTITNGAYCFKDSLFYFGDRFFPDVARRELFYSGSSKYPICAMHRIKKYQDKGFTVSGATIMHIALSIVQLKIENYAQLKEQLMGIDTMYLQKLLEAKDPNAPIDYGEFVDEAFRVIDHVGSTLAELEEEEYENSL